MIIQSFRTFLPLLCLLLGAALRCPAAPHTFAVAGNDFQLDGKKLLIVSGELHYPRVPRMYWRDRMKKMKAMGLNTLTTYVFWNAHESERGKFDFTGDLNVAEFVRTAQEEGLWVILRPGPYVCAEWDLGGFPAWLLRDPSLRIRQNDAKFLEAASAYMKQVGRQLAPLMVTHGGPILMVQVENEYGSFGADHAYMEAVRHMIREAGFDGQLYTADGSSEKQLTGGTLPDLPAAINFGNEQEPAREFAKLAKLRPTGPRMCGEFWAGWFDTWGEKHQTTPVERAAAALDWMLSRGISVSLYMIHGGTSFGFHAGADFRKSYMPDTTSYDYDSPIDEAGRTNAKFTALRNVIRRYLPEGTALPDPPAQTSMISIPRFEFREAKPLAEIYGAPTASKTPLSMEELGLAHGLVVYRTKVKQEFHGGLELDKLHDYAIVYADGKPLGTVDRRLEQRSIPVDLKSGGTLEVLVDAMGHINFGPELLTDRKGLTAVRTGGTALEGWEIYGVPLTDPPHDGFAAAKPTGPAFYRAKFEVGDVGDTYLRTSGWGKGYVWLNGHNLGRYWNVGPQQTLYVPAGWLNAGANEVVVLDLDPSGVRSMAGVQAPVWETAAIAH
jgi:beta-galactosidase